MSIKYTHQIVSIISDLRRGGGTLSHTSLLLNKLCNTHKTINTARSQTQHVVVLKNENYTSPYMFTFANIILVDWYIAKVIIYNSAHASTSINSTVRYCVIRSTATELHIR